MKYELELHMDNGEVITTTEVEANSQASAVQTVYATQKYFNCRDAEGRFYHVHVDKISYVLAKEPGSEGPFIGYA